MTQPPASRPERQELEALRKQKTTLYRQSGPVSIRGLVEGYDALCERLMVPPPADEPRPEEGKDDMTVGVEQQPSPAVSRASLSDAVPSTDELPVFRCAKCGWRRFEQDCLPCGVPKNEPCPNRWEPDGTSPRVAPPLAVMTNNGTNPEREARATDAIGAEHDGRNEMAAQPRSEDAERNRLRLVMAAHQAGEHVDDFCNGLDAALAEARAIDDAAIAAGEGGKT